MLRRDLSVIIPSRNEPFLNETIEDILRNAEANTDIIVILDGYWPDSPVKDHPRVTIIHHTESVGQRGATNDGARLSNAEFIMKVDAHCSFGKGFDRILISDCKPDWTMIPSMWNLHVFDWECKSCHHRTYQGAEPVTCEECGHGQHEMVMVWKPRNKKITYSWRFDNEMQFQYWRAHHKRPEWRKKDLIETMSCIGACFFMRRDRFLDLGGMDEAHGSWGQFGTELACKAWLSGGKMVTTRKTWFAHMFRTGNFKGTGHAGATFPYPICGKAQEYAKQYSRDLWLNDRWPLAVHPLSWLVERFKPVPDWHE